MQKCAMPRHICLLCELPANMLIESYELNLQGYLGQQESKGGGGVHLIKNIFLGNHGAMLSYGQIVT